MARECHDHAGQHQGLPLPMPYRAPYASASDMATAMATAMVTALMAVGCLRCRVSACSSRTMASPSWRLTQHRCRSRLGEVIDYDWSRMAVYLLNIFHVCPTPSISFRCVESSQYLFCSTQAEKQLELLRELALSHHADPCGQGPEMGNSRRT